MLNEKLIKLPTVQYNQQEQFVDLQSGASTAALHCRIAGSITVTGANADGTLHDDQLQRLIPNLRLMWDSFPIIDNVPLRDLYQVFLRSIQEEPTQDLVTLAEIQAAGSYPFELHFAIPFARPWLINPADTHLPPFRVNNQLRLYVTWETAINAAGDSAGVGAIVSGGTDAYTWATEPTLEITQVTWPRASAQPAFLPVYTSSVTRTWAAAESALVERVVDDRMFDLIVFRQTYGTDATLQDALNNVTLKASGESNFIDDITYEILRAREAQIFPAVNEELGYLGLLMASGGRLSNRVVPSVHNDFRWEFDLDAPTSGDGVITMCKSELVPVPGVTRSGS